MSGSLTLLLVILGGLGLLQLFVADMSYDRQWSQERADLGAQGKWKELNEHFEGRMRTRRPLLRLFRAIASPGLLEADYAFHLSNCGLNEAGLEWADRAVRKSRFRKCLAEMTLSCRGTILCRLGRYDEARAAAAQAKSLVGNAGFPELVEAMVALYLGNLETALCLARTLLSHPRAKEAARVMVSGVLSLLGRYQQALDMLVYEPSNVQVFFSPKGLRAMTSDEAGQRLVLTMDQELAAITRPAQHLAIADVCLQAEDRENCEHALERAARELKSNLAIQHIYERSRATCCAMGGDVLGTEQHLALARQLADEFPSRSAKYETHQAAGRSYLLIGRPEAAVVEFRAAAQLALHPIEKHSTNYWLARATEAAGDLEAAACLYNRVTADHFDTWMSADAIARSSQAVKL
jgi:tetratricopeptide (TPR) repeat protein